jgi:hypothetical protein
MKRIILIGFCVLSGYLTSYTQIMQASIGTGTTSTRIKIYIKPSLTLTAGNISTFQFDVAIDQSITPVPSLNFVGTPAFGSGWVIQPPYIEDGFRHYEVVSSLGGSLTLGAGVELEVMQLEFSGGPVTPNNVALYTLPLGGATGNALFLCTGAATSTEGQLYYNRGGVTVVNNLSYTGALPSSATLGGVVLPLNWLSFNVIKQGSDGLLNWVVANDDDNHHYELQRSANGTSDFKTIATVNKSGNADYKYTDANINSFGATTLYYRIKQVDVNGRTSYSDVRLLRLDVKGNLINVFPNPVKKGFYVNIPFNNSERGNVKLNLVGNNGQLVRSRQITTVQASNYYFDIADMALAAGSYNLQIVFDEKIMETKKLNIIR